MDERHHQGRNAGAFELPGDELIALRDWLLGRQQVLTHRSCSRGAGLMRAKILAKPASAHRRLLLVRYDDGGACADGLLRELTAFNARGARERGPSLRAQRGER